MALRCSTALASILAILGTVAALDAAFSQQVTSLRKQQSPARPTAPSSEPTWGPVAERNRLVAEGEAIKTQAEQLQKTRKSLEELQDSFGKAVDRVAQDRSALNRRANNFRCPNGYTLEQCFARPPVCSQAMAMRSYVATEQDRISRQARSLKQTGERLKEITDSYNQQLNSLKRRRDRWSEDVSAIRRPQAPSSTGTSTLSFDEMAPKRK